MPITQDLSAKQRAAGSRSACAPGAGEADVRRLLHRGRRVLAQGAVGESRAGWFACSARVSYEGEPCRGLSLANALVRGTPVLIALLK